jgi:hypothetical protein
VAWGLPCSVAPSVRAPLSADRLTLHRNRRYTPRVHRRCILGVLSLHPIAAPYLARTPHASRHGTGAACISSSHRPVCPHLAARKAQEVPHRQAVPQLIEAHPWPNPTRAPSYVASGASVWCAPAPCCSTGGGGGDWDRNLQRAKPRVLCRAEHGVCQPVAHRAESGGIRVVAPLLRWHTNGPLRHSLVRRLGRANL